MPFSEIDLIKLTIRCGQFKAAGVDSFVDTLLADVKPKLDLAIDLKPVTAKIAFSLFSLNKSFVHLIIKYIHILLYTISLYFTIEYTASSWYII